MPDDSTLLHLYAETGSQDAFTQLVNRHLTFVYSTARRFTGSPHRAQEVTQTVFTDFARKARTLKGRSSLAGWLFTSVHYAAAKLARSEGRRAAHEHAAASRPDFSEETRITDWSVAGPLLDGAIGRLTAQDREAVLLRYYKEASFARIGALLGLPENTARMRVSRAVERLRKMLAGEGVASAAAALEFAMAAEAATPTIPMSASVVSATALTSAALPAASLVFPGFLMSVSKLTLTGLIVVTAASLGYSLHERSERRAAEAQIVVLRESIAQEIAKTKAASVPLSSQVKRPALASTPHTSNLATALLAASKMRPLPSLEDPAYAEKIAGMRKEYGPFLAKRQLTTEQTNRLLQLWLAWDDLHEDLQAAVSKANVDDDSDESVPEQLRREVFAPLEGEIEDVLGSDGVSSNYAYQKSYFWNLVSEPAANAVNASGEPLSDTQANQLTDLVMANNHPYKVNPTDISTRISIDWPSVASEAKGILSPSQGAALQAALPQLKSRR